VGADSCLEPAVGGAQADELRHVAPATFGFQQLLAAQGDVLVLRRPAMCALSVIHPAAASSEEGASASLGSSVVRQVKAAGCAGPVLPLRGLRIRGDGPPGLRRTRAVSATAMTKEGGMRTRPTEAIGGFERLDLQGPLPAVGTYAAR
jgi:hypothetical protein